MSGHIFQVTTWSWACSCGDRDGGYADYDGAMESYVEHLSRCDAPRQAPPED